MLPYPLTLFASLFRVSLSYLLLVPPSCVSFSRLLLVSLFRLLLVSPCRVFFSYLVLLSPSLISLSYLLLISPYQLHLLSLSFSFSHVVSLHSTVSNTCLVSPFLTVNVFFYPPPPALNSVTRVRLPPLKEDPTLEYINANYIRGFGGRNAREYIAAQAPMDTGIYNFWRLILHSGTRIVVMVTGTS